jgi:hypothetical protein
MMDLIVHLLHFCASCVSDNSAIPPAAGLLGGAVSTVGGFGDPSARPGSSDPSGIPPDGPIVPPVNAQTPPTQPNAQPGNSAGHGTGPTAPPASSDPGGPIPFTAPDGTHGLEIRNSDGTTDRFGTDAFGNPTFSTTDPNGVTQTTTSGVQGITNSTTYPGGFKTSITVLGGSLTQSTIYPGGAGTFVTTDNGAVTTGVVSPDGSKFGTTTETDGTHHTSFTPPMPP